MQYVSTRGSAPRLGFEDVTLAGLAADGGLYVPETWPSFSTAEIAALRGLSYADTAVAVMKPFVAGALDDTELKSLCEAAYGRFAHAAVVPLKQLDHRQWLLELFHGPTLAFKDVALQLLGLLFERFLAKRDTHLTVIGATSGDTGSAAIDALAGRAKVDIFMLHPKGRVSEVQRRQMTTVLAPNIHNIAIEGSFDDAQALVKAMFADADFASRFNAVRGQLDQLGAADGPGGLLFLRRRSPRRARPAGGLLGSDRQFRRRVRRLCRDEDGPADRPADRRDQRQRHPPPRAVEGRLFGRHGHAHRRPVDGHPGQLEFERLLFDLHGRDGTALAATMKGFESSKRSTFPPRCRPRPPALFASARIDADRMQLAMRWAHDRAAETIDPHSAIGLAAAQDSDLDPSIPIVTLATAHPAKFGDAVERATGNRPILPARIGALFERQERYEVLPAEIGAIESFVADQAATVA
jgi:threonine synthase